MTRKSLRTKRIFSIILSLAVALTMMPMSALAADGTSTVENAVANDGAEKYYLGLQDAFAGVEDHGTVTMLKPLGDKMISFCKDTNEQPVDKTVTLMMNGNSLSFEGAPTLYIQSGKLIIGDEATISQTEKTPQPAVFVDNDERSKDRGTLEFKGKANLTGGLLIQNWGKLEGGLKEGTIITSNDTYSVSVKQSTDTYDNVLGLLGEGLAFAKYDTNKENNAGALVNGNVKKMTEDVVVVAHTTHDMTDGACACGYTCSHKNADGNSAFENGVCTICKSTCAHTDVGDDGVCKICKAQMLVKIENGGKITYGTDFKSAMNAAENGTTVTLLADIAWGVTPQSRAAITGDGKIVTLNLNRHTITGGWLDIGSNDNPTSCTLKIIGEGSHVSLDGSGGYSGVFPKATLDLSEWEGGTINAINISDNSNYEAASREAAVIVGPKAGTIGKLSFGNNQLDKLKKTKLSGGSFNEIWAAAHQPVKLGDLLVSGYALQYKDGSYEQHTKTLQDESIYNVKVVKCLHPNMKPGKDGVATCEYCGKSGKFVASVDGNLYTADQWKDAFEAWLGDAEDEKANGILKLYTNYEAEAADATWSVGYRPNGNTLDLNGHRMSVKGDGAFKPTNNMHLTVTDSMEIGQITNILLDGSQHGSFTLESGYVGHLEMTGGAVVTLEGGSVDELDVQKSSANTNLSIQGGRIGKLNIKDWAEGMHVSATGGSLGAYNLPSGKILADVLDHQYYAEGTSLDKGVDAAQKPEKFVIKHAPHDFGSTSKTANVPINGRIPFTVDSPSENVGVYEVKWYRRTTSGAEHMVENKVADVNVGDKLDVFCVITGLDRPDGAMQWQVAVKDYTLTVTKIDLANATVTIDPWRADGKFRFNPHASETAALAFFSVITVTANGEKYTLKENDYTYEGATATRVGKYTLTITATDSCAKFKGSKTFDWEVIPYTLHEPSFLGQQTYTKTYDGTTTLPEYTFRALFPGKGSDSEVDWREDKYKNNYEVTAAEFVSADAGKNKPINQTITLKNKNFVFAPTEMINIKGITTTDKTITYTNFTPIETYPTLGTTFNIEKADAPAARGGARLRSSTIMRIPIRLICPRCCRS